MNTRTDKKNTLRPIRFSRLIPGSDYQIFAEPSRNVGRSKDKTVYTKVSESSSFAKDNPDKHIILYPKDLVVPLSRGSK